MRKSTLFISAALTTFVLAVLAAGVASAFQAVTSKTDSSAPQPQQQMQQPSVSEKLARNVVATQAAVLSPEQAAQWAAQVIGRTDLYSVEMTTWNGVQAFLVTFSSGDLVYLSPTGQILSITKLQTVAASVPRGGGGGGGKGSGGGGEEHENGESAGGGEHEGSESGGGDD